jgi:hypothetical protein
MKYWDPRTGEKNGCKVSVSVHVGHGEPYIRIGTEDHMRDNTIIRMTPAQAYKFVNAIMQARATAIDNAAEG